MRTQTDALRSMKRHVAAELPPFRGRPWEIRLANEDGSMQYPYALVAAVGPAASSETALLVTVTQPFTVYAYPAPADSFEQGMLDAGVVADALWAAFVGGLTPYRVPLYDYDGVGLDEGSDEREDSDYLRLTDVQVNRVPDALDEHRVIVVCDMRARWARSTARLSALRGGPVLQSVRQRLIVEGAQQAVAPAGLKIEVTFGRPSVSKA